MIYKNLILSILFIFLNIPFIFGKGEDAILDKFLNKKYNVILISVDTLRADHLGCYGYFRNTSPNIDKFAKQATLFQNAFSQASATMPSHASLFTSQYVYQHKVVGFSQDKLCEDNITLAEVLKLNGYKTAAFTGGGHLHQKFGFNQGFDVYHSNDEEGEYSGSFSESVPLALDWIEKNINDKFFIFLHSYDVHMPFMQPTDYLHFFDQDYTGMVDSLGDYHYFSSSTYNGYYISKNDGLLRITDRDKKHLIAHYDGCIKYADFWIGKFLNKISTLALLDNAIIIILSDHGEELFEHGRIFTHGDNAYDGVIHVPLIIYHPGMKEFVRIEQQLELIDVLPTILDFLGLNIPDPVQGQSLRSFMESNNRDLMHNYIYSWWSIVRSPEWKLIGRSLYNLKSDPNELHDVSKYNPEIYIKLLKELENWKNKQFNNDDNKNQFKKIGYW